MIMGRSGISLKPAAWDELLLSSAVTVKCGDLYFIQTIHCGCQKISNQHCNKYDS